MNCHSRLSDRYNFSATTADPVLSVLMEPGEADMPSEINRQPGIDAGLKLVLTYAAFAGLWILLSDQVIAWMFSDVATLTLASTFKGWIFVLVTSLLLYALIRRLTYQLRAGLQREKAALTANQRTQHLLDLIADGSCDTIYAKDLSGRYVLCNREMARIVGKTSERIIGYDDTDLFPPAQAATLRANDRLAIAGQQGSSYEETVHTVDGELTYQSIKGALRDEGGQVVGVFGISRNITETKRIEAALLDREFRLSAIIGHSPSALSLKHPDGRYALANPNLQRIHHCAEEEIIGKTDFDLYPEETARRLQANDEVVVRTQARHSIEEIIPVDGQARTFMSHMFPVPDAAGDLRYICRISLDITERKLHEDSLKTALIEVERANNAKSRFLAAASHDLRQPLAAISIYAGMLKNTPRAADRKVVANLQECIASLSALLKNLLDLSKLEAGVTTASISDFSVREMFEAMVPVHAPEALVKRLDLRFVPSPLFGRTDAVLFRRVLDNLVENAIRYTEHGGVLIGCRRRQGKVWVEVWDTGLGIPAAQTEEIFDEFKQLHDGARNKGSGLGLAIVAKTAALLGLAISVRSRPGRGSVFSVELPLGESVAVIPASPEAVSRPLRIAFVEDNQLVRDALLAGMQYLGHDVVAAATLTTLLAGLEQVKPDIVVSDYRLQEEATGIEVIQAVRARFGDELPAILITGDTDPNLLRSMADRGMVVLHKPVDMETLQAHIEDMTCRNTAAIA